MSWRRVAVIYAVLAMLAGWIAILDRTPPPAATDAPATPGPSLLDVDAAAVSGITLRRDAAVVRAVREQGQWRILEPAGAQIPPDLLEATIATLTKGQSSEALETGPQQDLAAYGLETPSASLEIAVAGGSTAVTVTVGGRNPTRTAVYARRSDRAAIYLVGMNLSYYIDLVFDAAKT